MVKVKTFGVIRLGSGVKELDCNASTVEEAFEALNIKSAPDAETFGFGDAIVFVNGTRLSKKKFALHAGDEVWLMSTASGG